MSKLKPIGRRTQYTQDTIQRAKCFKCKTRPAKEQFNICALGGRFVPICPECDVELNALVLNWLDVPEKDERMKIYQKKMLGQREHTV